MAGDAAISQAVRLLRDGRLVAFPTETVYGLGADALNADAVRRIFTVKGRPAGHPLIVHVAGIAALSLLAESVSPLALRLAERFWPGPLTLVLRRSERVPLAVTGGQPTVAIRVPAHPVALELLAAFDGPIAAPSANRFGQISPTSADHVRRDFGDAVDCVLDGGESEVGVESTIVDLTRGEPIILRPGGVSAEALGQALGRPIATEQHGPVRAPGQLPSHYAPRAQVWVVAEAELPTHFEALRRSGDSVGALLPEGVNRSGIEPCITLPNAPEGYARGLYAGLRALDHGGVGHVLVVLPEETGIGVAVADRIRRAAAPRD